MTTQLLNELRAQTTNTEVREFIDRQVAARLAGRNPQYPIPSQTEVEHVIDYLNARAETHTLRLRRASYESVLHQAEQWVERMNRKAEGVVETEEDTEVVRTWDSGFRLVKLTGKAAFEREGALMSHCVSSYYNKSNTTIYSLRDHKNNPHCTLEVTGDDKSFNQIKGKGNGSIHPKYIKYILDILTDWNISVRGSELSNLGYDSLGEDLWKLYDHCYYPVKSLTFGGERYFYRNQTPKLKISMTEAVAWLKQQ